MIVYVCVINYTVIALDIVDLFFCSSNHSNCILQVYYMSTKTKFNVIYCNNMFHSHSILKSTFPTPSTFPP